VPQMKSVARFLLILLAVSAHGATLPGFRVTKLGATNGFLTGIAIDSHGTIYYTTQAGTLYRFDAATSTSTPLASVVTDGNSNSGLLGLALVDDDTAVVHYTTPGQTYDVLSRIDLTTGIEQQIHAFACDIDVPSRGSSPEHHGGTPSIASDGSIVMPIGDYGGGLIASLPQWNGGKVFRITPAGDIVESARGMRNPYGAVWDPATQRMIVADNGANTGDALFVLTEGANCGWPFSFGGQPFVDGIAQPVWFFPQTIAPTALMQLNGRNAQLQSGILIGAYVTKSLYFVPDVDAKPMPAPMAILNHETPSIIGVAQSRDGEILVGASNAIYRLNVPIRGDCNGDGVVNSADVDALEHELVDAPKSKYAAQSWGCDVNGDGIVDATDLDELIRMTGFRRRAVRSVH